MGSWGFTIAIWASTSVDMYLEYTVAEGCQGQTGKPNELLSLALKYFPLLSFLPIQWCAGKCPNTLFSGEGEGSIYTSMFKFVISFC